MDLSGDPASAFVLAARPPPSLYIPWYSDSVKHEEFPLPVTYNTEADDKLRDELKKLRPKYSDEKIDQMMFEINTWAEILLDSYDSWHLSEAEKNESISS